MQLVKNLLHCVSKRGNMAQRWSKSYDATALIGCWLPSEKLFAKQKIKAFEHDYPESMKFCHQTGRPLWKEATVCVLCPNKAVEDLKSGEKIGPFVLHIDHQRRWFCLAITKVFTEDAKGKGGVQLIPLTHDDAFSLQSLRTKLKETLLPHNLWDDKNFGLWSILDFGTNNNNIKRDVTCKNCNDEGCEKCEYDCDYCEDEGCEQCEEEYDCYDCYDEGCDACM